jgi:hypothetical protein
MTAQSRVKRGFKGPPLIGGKIQQNEENGNNAIISPFRGRRNKLFLLIPIGKMSGVRESPAQGDARMRFRFKRKRTSGASTRHKNAPPRIGRRIRRKQGWSFEV